MTPRFHDIAALTLALALVLWAGCQAAAPGGPPGEPDWVSSARPTAPQGQFISAVGSAPSDQPDPMAAADRQARQGLATLVSEYVSNVVGDFLESGAAGADVPEAAAESFRRTLASDVAATTLRAAERKDTWREAGGKTYVLYQVPTDSLDARVRSRARAILEQENPFGLDAEAFSGALGEFLAAPRIAKEPLSTPTAGSGAEPADAAPSWLESPPEDRFPPERYVTAVGLGPSVAEAEADGRAEITGHVNASVEMLVRTGVAGDTALLPEDVSGLRKGEPRFEPAGVPAIRPVTHWLDPATQQHYVLLALDRAAAASVLADRARAALADSRQASEAGRTAEGASAYAGAFRQKARAWEAARRAVVLHARAVALAPVKERAELAGLIEEPIVNQTRDELRSLAEALEVTKARGDEQWVRPGHAPADPFVVRVSKRGQDGPVAGIPVRVTTAPPERLLLGRATTDNAGVAAWRAGTALPRRGMRGAVLAEVDVAHLTPDLDLPEFQQPSVRFNYYFRSPETTSFVVAFEGGVAATEAASAVRRALTAEGFNPVSRADLLAHTRAVVQNSDHAAVRTTEEFAELAGCLGPSQALMVVTGTVGSNLVEVTQTSEGMLAVAECPFSIRVLDPGLAEGGRLVAEVTGAGRGWRLDDRAEALRRAREDAVRRVSSQLLEALRGRFPGMRAAAGKAG